MQEVREKTFNDLCYSDLDYMVTKDEELASLIKEMVKSLVYSINQKKDKDFKKKLKNLFEILENVNDFVIEVEIIRKKNKTAYKKRFNFKLFIHKLLECHILNDSNLESFCVDLDSYHKKLEEDLKVLGNKRYEKIDNTSKNNTGKKCMSKRKIKRCMNRKKRARGSINDIMYLLSPLRSQCKEENVIKNPEKKWLKEIFDLGNEEERIRTKSVDTKIKRQKSSNETRRPKSIDVKIRDQKEF